MSQTTESNVNYVCNFSLYCCLCTLCIRSMSRRQVSHMGKHWSIEARKSKSFVILGFVTKKSMRRNHQPTIT